MKGIYLVNYTVKGIKSLDEEVSLSFYKKTITSDPKDFQNIILREYTASTVQENQRSLHLLRFLKT